MRELAATDLPADAGVYALYRDGERMYVGKAGSLRRSRALGGRFFAHRHSMLAGHTLC